MYPRTIEILVLILIIFDLPDYSQAVDGGWSHWSEWTFCSSTCGQGLRKRFRECDNPAPNFGGRWCSGPNLQTGPCRAPLECSVDGQWSSWSKWSICSVTCGSGGSRLRYRSCNNPPPSGNGIPCDGSLRDIKRCSSTVQCPVYNPDSHVDNNDKADDDGDYADIDVSDESNHNDEKSSVQSDNSDYYNSHEDDHDSKGEDDDGEDIDYNEVKDENDDNDKVDKNTGLKEGERTEQITLLKKITKIMNNISAKVGDDIDYDDEDDHDANDDSNVDEDHNDDKNYDEDYYEEDI